MSTAATDPPYTVVVGVSATSKSPSAVTWAAAQARANHGLLVAVRVFKRQPFPDLSTTPPSEAQDQVRRDHQADLDADIADVLGPDHEAECRVLYGGKRRTLLAVTGGADLLVIDAARTPSASALLAHRIIASSGCPVVVMPPALTGEAPPGIVNAGRAAGRAALRAVGTSGRPGFRPPESH